MMEDDMMAAKDSSDSQNPSYTRNGTKTQDTNSLRASEVGNPAPAGHFIRQFGGSPRDQIQVSHKQAAVDQVLAIMNGYVEKNIISNKNSALMKGIASQTSSDDKVNYAFKTILQRKPSTKERNDFKDMLKRSKSQDTYKRYCLGIAK